MTDRKTMIAEATELGLEFKGNISNVKLAELINSYDGSPPALDEEAPAGPAVKEETAEETAEEQEEVTVVTTTTTTKSAASAAKTPTVDPHHLRRLRILEAKKKAKETMVVTLTNRDNRENDFMTTAYLSVENQYFAVSKIVPLDMPVALEVCLIAVAASTTMTLHKAEIGKDGNPTGNKVPVTVKKFAISYSHTQT